MQQWYIDVYKTENCHISWTILDKKLTKSVQFIFEKNDSTITKYRNPRVFQYTYQKELFVATSIGEKNRQMFKADYYYIHYNNTPGNFQVEERLHN